MTLVPAPAFGLIEAPLPRVVDAYKDMLVERAHAPARVLRESRVTGPLGEALAQLTSALEERHLLVPTASEWVAYFDTAVPPDPLLAAGDLPDRLGCRTLVLYASPSTVGFALQGPGHAGMFDAIRVVIVASDEPQPQTYGAPLPFEDTDPRALRIELGWLERYCGALGLRPFDDGFYFPPGSTGHLVSPSAPSPRS